MSRRTPAALLVAVLAVLLVPLSVGSASAHGAPTRPLSRAAECGGEGTRTGSPACRAALEVSPDLPTQWDNLRVAGVDGRDRQVIPDGRLCSGGKPGFAGLDLPREDWPLTALTAGAPLTFTYRGTIPHAGSFRVYVTKPGYSPTKPLTWAALESEPFADVTDPPFADGSYSFAATLPSGLTGRHLIYTIWQNSSSSDTYYSCSDVVFGDGAAADPADPAPLPPAAQPPSSAQVAPAASARPAGMPVVLAAVAVVAVGGALGALLVSRRRRR
jgi:predicted carbohydrate-binding protein with CBM5 and CBM33 domain